MGEERRTSEGAGEGRDCLPVELWAGAVSWLGELMYQVDMGEPYEDEGDFLSNNPCDRLWAVGRDFDVALATLVVVSVMRDPDSRRVARMYLDGLVPPEWSACGRFFKEGLAEGDFHDIGIEIAPDMTTALQRLVDDIPLEAWRRWGEISTEHPEDPVCVEMDCWLEGLEKCSDLFSAICYIEMHPPHFWSLGWEFDRELLRCLAVKVAYCEEGCELERLIDALDVPFTATTESLISRSALRRSEFLKLCKPEVWDARDWAFAFGRLVPWIEGLGELEKFLRKHPCSDAWWREREFDRVVATGLWEAVDGCAPDPDEVESMLAVLEVPRGTMTDRVKSFLIGAKGPYVRPRYLGLSLGDALDELDRAAGSDSIWAPEGMRYHMEMLVAGLECVASSLRDAVLVCHRHLAKRYWAFGREFDRGIFEQLSDLIDEDGELDEVLALGDALEPPTDSDTWALIMVRLKDMALPGTSWRDLVQAHPWIGDAHTVSVPAFNGGESRGKPAVNGFDAGRIRQPAKGRKSLKTLGVVALVLIIAAVAFAGYARWHDERLHEEHEAYMASLERLDRGELEAAIAANAEINEAFIKAELADDGREDALAEDVEVLSIDLEDGELISGWVNATCTVRGFSSGVVYEVDLALRDDGVVKYVFGYMVADERFE